MKRLKTLICLAVLLPGSGLSIMKSLFGLAGNFRRLVFLLSFIVMVVGPAAAPGRISPQNPTPPPGDVLTPRTLQMENWSGKPVRSPQGWPTVPEEGIIPQSLAEYCSAGENPHGLQIAYSTMAYTVFFDKDWEIIVHGACAVSSVARITTNPATDYAPRLSFDANQVVYVSDRDGNDEIYSAVIKDQREKRLTDHKAIDTMPSFSPAGNSIVFVSNRSGYPEIYSMDQNGQSFVQLTQFNMYALYPDWSPDGRQIVFALSNGSEGIIMMMDSDGRNARPLTNILPGLGRVRWSPSGTQLAFEADFNLDGWFDLGTINADGSNLNSLRMGSVGHDLEIGNWSADETIMFYADLKYQYYSNPGGWYLDSSSVYMLEIHDGWNSAVLEGGSPSLNFDIRNPDRLAPVSFIDPLPDWARAGFSYFTFGWTAYDLGPSGLYTNRIEIIQIINEKEVNLNAYYITNPGEGQNQWKGSAPLSPNPGDTYYFRTLVGDFAGNRETEHARKEEIVQFYNIKADGQILDMREHPVMNAQANISPLVLNTPRSDAAGQMNVYFPSTGTYQIDFERDGLASLPAWIWAANADRNFQTILPGIDEQVTNGQFVSDTPLSGWQIDGPLTVVEDIGREGGKGADIFQPCSDELCLTTSEQVAQAATGEIILDSQGLAHVITNTGDYYTRLANGVWQSGTGLPPGNYIDLKSGPDDTLYALTSAPDIRIYRKPTGGFWSQLTVPVNSIEQLDIDVDLPGRLHIAYLYQGTLTYSYLLPNDTWQTPCRINEPWFSIREIEIKAAPDGTVHFVYSDNKFTVTASRLPDGSLTPEKVFSYGDYDRLMVHPQFALGPDGTLHLAWRNLFRSMPDGEIFDQYLIFYASKPPGGTWQDMERIWDIPLSFDDSNLDNYHRWGGIAVDANNTVHLALVDISSTHTNNNLVYLTRAAGLNEWIVKKNASPLTGLDFLLGPHGEGHLLIGASNRVNYQVVAFDTNGNTGSLSQQISLPETMHKPTLSFFYQLEQLVPANDSSVQVSVIEDGKAPVSIMLEQGASNNWTHAWTDLTPWQGKTVTLQFKLFQSLGEYQAHLKIDEVSVSSWTTPLLHASSPSQITNIPPEGTWLTLQGDNLMDGSTVYLNETPAGPVVYDAATGDLQVWLAPGLEKGKYDIRLVAPGGMDAILPSALQIGINTYLAMIQR